MTRISATSPRRPPGAASQPGAAAPQGASAVRFSLPPTADAAASDIRQAAPTAPPMAILTLQEVDPPAPDQSRNNHARKHATALLDLLSALQRGLLADAADPSLTDRLTELLDTPAADDPALAGILRAIACRAAVEIARRSTPQGTP